MPDGRTAGNVSIDQAKYLASQYELDLVLINVNASPPIAKILDYNKFRYQQEKQARGTSKKVSQLKEVRLSYRIDPHDLATKANQARKFLEDGHLVRVFIKLRGRENLFPEQAKTGLEKFLELCGGQWEQSITRVDKRIQAVIKPKK